MSISVVIPTYNEEAYVRRLLEDLINQTVKPEKVIIADCKSEDGTVPICKKYANRLKLEIVCSPDRSAAAARNSGAVAAKSAYLLFLDADMRIPKDFLEQIALVAKTKGADFVSPRIKAENHHPIDSFVAWYIYLWIWFYHMLLRRRAMGIGGAMLIKKSRHEDINGFDPAKREFDDIDYCRRLNKLGISFAFAWKAMAITSSRRFEEQGRIRTVIQGLPDNHLLVRRLVRPSMKRLGIEPKWNNKV